MYLKYQFCTLHTKTLNSNLIYIIFRLTHSYLYINNKHNYTTFTKLSIHTCTKQISYYIHTHTHNNLISNNIHTHFVLAYRITTFIMITVPFCKTISGNTLEIIFTIDKMMTISINIDTPRSINTSKIFLLQNHG